MTTAPQPLQADAWQPALRDVLQQQTQCAETAFQALASIRRVCAQHEGISWLHLFEEIDALAAAAQAKVAPVLAPVLPPAPAVALPPWGVFEPASQALEDDMPVAQRNAALHDMMADTVDPEPAGLAVAVARAAPDDATAPPATPTDAEWRRDSLQMQREMLDLAWDAEQAALHWRKLSSTEASQRAEAAQRAADARHDAQLQAIGQVRLSPRDIASGVLNALPPETDAATEAAIVDRRVRLALSYPDDASQPLPAPPADAPPPQHPAPPVQTPVPPPAPVPAPVPEPGPLPPVLAEPLTAEQFCALRGFDFFNSRGEAPAKAWSEMQGLGANVVRCWYVAEWVNGRYFLDPERVARMRGAVTAARVHGLAIVVCLDMQDADMPLGRVDRAAAFVDLWAEIERLHADQPDLVFDLLNEPRPIEGKLGGGYYTSEQHAATGQAWRELSLAVLGAIRALNQKRLCVVQMGLGADPAQFTAQAPLPLPNLVYSAHVYLPHSYTHHGVPEAVSGQPIPPPVPFDFEARQVAQQALNRLGDWSDRYGLPIYIGETAAHRALPDAHQYVALITEYCNSRQWPWCYHEWRGDPVWQPTEQTLQVLRAALQAGKTSRQ